MGRNKRKERHSNFEVSETFAGGGESTGGILLLKEYLELIFKNSFFLFIFVAVFAQLIGHYYARRYLVIDRNFLSLWVILRILIPLVVLGVLSRQYGDLFSRLGLGMPRLDRNISVLLLLAFVALPLAFLGIMYFLGYFGQYSGYYSDGVARLQRFKNFMIFTSSTLTGWEFLHRVFLLMGGIYILEKVKGLSERNAISIMVLIVCVFESVFHFLKPHPLEALALLFGSPFLSYLALRTRSVWTSFAVHFYIEVLFIGFLIYGK